MSALPEFIITRQFNAPIDRVWQAWTDPKLIARWFGPKGCECAILKQELVAGGVQHSRIQMPGAPAMYGRFVYREIVPGSRLVWEHSFSDETGENLARHPFSPTWPLQLLTTVNFTEKDGGTEIHLSWVPLNANPVEIETFRAALDGMEQGWGGSFDQLEEFLKA